MGFQTHATLAFGYHLSSHSKGWYLAGVEDGGAPDLDWFDPDRDEFEEAAMGRLLASVGFAWTDDDSDRSGEYDAALAVLGVDFTRTGYEGGDLFLVSAVWDPDMGDVEEIEPAELLAAASDEAQGKLRAALEVLGLTPEQEQPAWLLTTYRG